MATGLNYSYTAEGSQRGPYKANKWPPVAVGGRRALWGPPIRLATSRVNNDDCLARPQSAMLMNSAARIELIAGCLDWLPSTGRPGGAAETAATCLSWRLSSPAKPHLVPLVIFTSVCGGDGGGGATVSRAGPMAPTNNANGANPVTFQQFAVD